MDEKEAVYELLRKAEQRLVAARYLLEKGFCEDSANRAYYSMFFAATALLLTRGITVRTHRGLIATFGSEFVQTGFIDPEFGKVLRIAEELREEVDYPISRVLPTEEVQAVVDDAERFLEENREKIRLLTFPSSE